MLFDPRVEDLHVAPHWGPILEQRSWSARSPWDLTTAKPSYGPDRWARSTGILARSVHLDISPDLTAAQVDRIGEVLGGALARMRG